MKGSESLGVTPAQLWRELCVALGLWLLGKRLPYQKHVQNTASLTVAVSELKADAVGIGVERMNKSTAARTRKAADEADNGRSDLLTAPKALVRATERADNDLDAGVSATGPAMRAARRAIRKAERS